MTQVSQVNLLNQYATRRDAEAFAKIVEQYQRLIFSTCRRKLHNSQDVDDAVQETFLRLAHKAGELHSNIGGWLHRCAVNVSVDMNRRRSARQKHEHAAATDKPLGKENAQIEWSELREHLDAALEKLDAEQRELIIERFFVGRPQVEMAAEVGVSPSTMTRRIESAIEAMRGHLQSMGTKTVGAGGAGGAIAAALQAETASAAVPAALTANLMKIGLSGTGGGAAAGAGGAGGAGAGAGGAATASGVAAGAFIGSAAMKLLVGLAAALVIAAGSIFAVVKSRPAAPAPQAPPPPAAVADVAVTIAAVPTAQGTVAPPPRWQSTTVAAGAAALEGIIRDGGGNPVAGATVTLQGGTYDTTKTDANGHYAFATVRGAGEYRIAVQAAGFVALQPYATGEAGLQLTPQSKARRDIVLQRGVKVRVAVKDVTGAGIANVGVDTNLRGGNYRTQPAERVNTNELGIASLTLPVSTNTYVLGASKDEFEPKSALVTPESVDKPVDIEIVMLPGLAIKGVAMCKDGKPAAGWEVSAKPEWWSSNYIPKSAPIDENGNFTLNNVGSGKYELTVWRKSSDGGGTSVSNASYTFPPSKQPIRIDIAQPSPASMVKLTGKVKFIGAPSESVSVTAMSANGGWFHSRVVPASEARARAPRPRASSTSPATRAAPAPRPPNNNEGTFTFESIPPGVYRISFESTTIEPLALENVKVPGELPEVIELKIVGKPKLSGVVVDGETGKPIPHFAIRLNKTETIGRGANYVQEPRWIQVSNPDGKFEVELVGPGVYQAQVSLEGYAWAWSTPVRIEKSGGKGNVELKVTKGGALSGAVFDMAGKPVAGAKVIAFSMAKAVGMRMEGRFEGDAGSVTTDASGKFLLEHLAGGADEKLKIVSPNHAPQIVEKLKVVEGKTTDLPPIKLISGGAVEGIVYDEAGKPQAGVALQFQDSSGYSGGNDEEAGRLAAVTSDASGKYRVDHLASGDIIYVNVADRWQRMGVTRRVGRPMEGKVAKLDFGGARPVKGRLLSLKKEPVANQRIELATDSPHFSAVMVNGKTDDAGNFTFAGPPVGRYTLYVMSSNERGEWTKVREFEVGDEPLDLGELSNDVGEVAITVAADDPTALKSIPYMTVSTDKPDAIYQDSVARAGPDAPAGANWSAKNVPVGKFRVTAHLRGASEDVPQIQVTTFFERKAGDAQTPVKLHIPRATAALTVTSTAPSSRADGREDMILIRSVDKRVEAYGSGNSSPPKPIKVPAGTYHLIDPFTMSPRADIEPIVLKDGESRALTIAPPSAASPAAKNAVAPITVQIVYWTPDGVLVTSGERKLEDASGKPQEPRGFGGIGRLFKVTPGKYKAVLERPGKPPVVKEITAAAPDPAVPENMRARWSPIHVLLD